MGQVVEAVNKNESEKLIRMVVDFGDYKRVIFTGVRSYGYTPEGFLSKKFLFVTNI